MAPPSAAATTPSILGTHASEASPASGSQPHSPSQEETAQKVIGLITGIQVNPEKDAAAPEGSVGSFMVNGKTYDVFVLNGARDSHYNYATMGNYAAMIFTHYLKEQMIINPDTVKRLVVTSLDNQPKWCANDAENPENIPELAEEEAAAATSGPEEDDEQKSIQTVKIAEQQKIQTLYKEISDNTLSQCEPEEPETTARPGSSDSEHLTIADICRKIFQQIKENATHVEVGGEEEDSGESQTPRKPERKPDKAAPTTPKDPYRRTSADSATRSDASSSSSRVEEEVD
jgi:hypothetical protein